MKNTKQTMPMTLYACTPEELAYKPRVKKRTEVELRKPPSDFPNLRRYRRTEWVRKDNNIEVMKDVPQTNWTKNRNRHYAHGCVITITHKKTIRLILQPTKRHFSLRTISPPVQKEINSTKRNGICENPQEKPKTRERNKFHFFLWNIWTTSPFRGQDGK